jgi:hypothetical protein
VIDEDFEPDLAGVPDDRFAVRSIEDVVARCEYENRQRPVAVVGHVQVIRTSEEVLTNGHGRSPARCVRYLRTKLLPLPDASAIVAGPSGSPFRQGRLYGEARIGGQVSASPYCALSGGGPTFCGPNARPPADPRHHTYNRAWAKRSESRSSCATAARRSQECSPPNRQAPCSARRSPSRPFGRTSTRK